MASRNKNNNNRKYRHSRLGNCPRRMSKKHFGFSNIRMRISTKSTLKCSLLFFFSCHRQILFALNSTMLIFGTAVEHTAARVIITWRRGNKNQERIVYMVQIVGSTSKLKTTIVMCHLGLSYPKNLNATTFFLLSLAFFSL